MDNDYWDEKSSSVILTQSFRQLPSSFAPKKLIKLSQNSASFRQFHPLTILSPTSSLPRSSPLSSLGDFDNGFNNLSDGNFSDNRYGLRQEFQFVNNSANRTHNNGGDNTSTNLQFGEEEEEFAEEDNEEQQASRSLMRQMIPMYNENNQHNNINNSSDIMNDRKDEDVDNNNCRYIVKMTPRSYQYQPHYQTQNHSYIKVAKLSG